MKFLQLSWQDLIKGIITAFLMAFVTSIYQIIQTGTLPSIAELKTAGTLGIGAMLAYLLKNLFTNSQDQFMKKEPQ